MLLGVRKATTNLVCYADLGYPRLSDLMKYKHHTFFHTMWSERANMVDDPLSFAFKCVITVNTPVGKLAAQMTRDAVPHVMLRNVHDDTIAHSIATRRIVYRNNINPHFLVSDVYTKRHTINDMRKMSLTRLCVCVDTVSLWKQAAGTGVAVAASPLEERASMRVWRSSNRTNSTWWRRAHTHDTSETSMALAQCINFSLSTKRT